MAKSILIVEDDQNIAELLQLYLNNEGYTTHIASDGGQGVDLFRKLSPDLHKLVKGVMIESYIEEGNQKVGAGCYGKSITDPCLGWEDSERLIYDIAEYE